jgi:hypothetical protein
MIDNRNNIIDLGSLNPPYYKIGALRSSTSRVGTSQLDLNSHLIRVGIPSKSKAPSWLFQLQILKGTPVKVGAP